MIRGSTRAPFVSLIDDPLVFADTRGRVQVLYEAGGVVLKRSSSSQGVFRGLHRQAAPALQEKIIRVMSGKILDFVTDPDDPDGVIWYREISPDSDWIYIGSHLAHGFYALEDAEFEYFCDGRYDEAREETFFVADAIGEALGLRNMQLSKKDMAGTRMTRAVRRFGEI